MRKYFASLGLAACLAALPAPALAGWRRAPVANPAGAAAGVPRPGAAAPATDRGPSVQQVRAAIRRVLALEILRLLLAQQMGGVDLLGPDVWFQIYLRAIADGLGAQIRYVPGGVVLERGAVRVEVRQGPGAVLVRRDGVQVVVPGTLTTGAAAAFWPVVDLLRTWLQVEALLLPDPVDLELAGA